jgi:hypothetical protein
MASALVQAIGQTTATATAISKAFTSNNTLGNLLVVCSATNANPAILDTLGNTWYVAANATDPGNAVVRMFYAPNCNAGANTITVTYNSGSTFDSLVISEWSGAETGPVVDEVATQPRGLTTPLQVGPIFPTMDGELVISYCVDPFGQSAGTGWTLVARPNNFTMQYQVQTSATPVTATWSGGGATYHAMIASFRPSGGTPAPLLSPRFVFFDTGQYHLGA